MSASKQVLRLTVENGRKKEMHNKTQKKMLPSVYVNPKLQILWLCVNIFFAEVTVDC